MKARRPRADVAAEDRGRHREGQRSGEAGHVVGGNAGGAPRGDRRRSRKTRRTKTGLEAEVVTLYQGGAVSPLSLQEVHRRAAGVRAGVRRRVLRRRSRQLHVPALLPRHDDLARLRERQAVRRSKNYLPWSTTGVKEGDAVFTSGHPGATQRLNTVAHLEFLRDQALPLSINAFTADPQCARRLRQAGPGAGAAGQRRLSSASRTR